MDKIFSARIDESIIHKITVLAHALKVSKKKIIEGAIEAYAQKLGKASQASVFEQTFGAWKRDETPQETVERGRKAFRDSMMRRRA